MLGPVRFTHIENCAREVCRTFKEVEEVESCIIELKDLESELSRLRAQLPNNDPADSSSQTAAVGLRTGTGTTKSLDYTDLLKPPDPARAKRLVRARQSAIKSVSKLLANASNGPQYTSQ